MTLEEQDVEAFTEAVKEYDSISRLDPWYDNSPQHRDSMKDGCMVALNMAST